MAEETRSPEEIAKDLEGAEVTELEDEALEGVAGGLPKAEADNNCGCGGDNNCGC